MSGRERVCVSGTNVRHTRQRGNTYVLALRSLVDALTQLLGRRDLARRALETNLNRGLDLARRAVMRRESLRNIDHGTGRWLLERRRRHGGSDVGRKEGSKEGRSVWHGGGTGRTKGEGCGRRRRRGWEAMTTGRGRGSEAVMWDRGFWREALRLWRLFCRFQATRER